MKKILTLVLSVVLVLGLISSFMSCEPSLEDLPSDERAVKLAKLADEKQDLAWSYDAEISGTIACKMNDIDVTADISGKMQRLITDSGAFVHHEETMEMTVSNNTVIVKKAEGFANGKAYINEVSNGSKTALYSEMTYDEYKAYDECNSDDALSEFNPENAESKSSMKRSDGGWSLVFEQFNDGAKEALAKGFEDMLDGATIDDVKVTIVLDEDLYYKVFMMDFTFPSDGSFQELSLRMDISDFNSETVEIDTIDFDDYTEVPDIRILRKLDDTLNYIPEEGEKQTVNVDISRYQYVNGSKSKTTETDSIVYEVVDGKFKYEITAVIPTGSSYNTKNTYVITYENGTQTIDKYNMINSHISHDTKESSDAAERAYVLGIINAFKYDISVVKTMKVSEDDPNTYILECAVPKALMDTSAFQSAKLTIELTLDENGEISKIYNEVYIKVSSLNADNYSFKVTCTFGEPAAE